MVFDGIDHKACRVFRAGLFKNVGSVGIYRALGYKQLLGNLLRGEAATDANQNIGLALL